MLPPSLGFTASRPRRPPARLDLAWLVQAHDATEPFHGPAWIFADGGGRLPDLGTSDIDAIPLLRDLIEGRTQDVALREDQGRDLGLHHGAARPLDVDQDVEPDLPFHPSEFEELRLED